MTSEVSEESLQALDKLADYLGRRDHSELELKKKLLQHFEIPAIVWAMTEAKDRGWLADPHELAEKVAESLHRKGKGHLYINRYLHGKGLPSVDKNTERELDKARQIAQYKLHKQSGFSYEEKGRLARWLGSRGYDNETVRALIYEE